MEQINEKSALLTDQIENENIKDLDELLLKESIENELNIATPDENEIRINENLIHLINFAKDSYKLIRSVTKQLPGLIKKDSFKYLRYSVSIFLLVFSLVFFLLTLYQEKDIYENVFNLFYILSTFQSANSNSSIPLVWRVYIDGISPPKV